MTLVNFKKIRLVLNRNENKLFNQIFVKEDNIKGRTIELQLTDEGLIRDTSDISIFFIWQNKTYTDIKSIELLTTDISKGLYRLDLPNMGKGPVDAYFKVTERNEIVGLVKLIIESQSLLFDESVIGQLQQKGMLDNLLVGTRILHNENELFKKIQSENISVNDINTNLKKVDKTYQSDELLQRIAENTPVNPMTVNDGEITTAKIADRAVTPIKTSFFEKETRNLFNKDKALINTAINTSGSLISHTSHDTSEMIPVQSSTQYIKNFGGVLAWYNSSSTFIRYVSTAEAQIGVPLTSPTNAAFVRFTIWKLYPENNIEWAQFEKGTKVTDYVPHRTIPTNFVENRPLAFPKKLNLLNYRKTKNVNPNYFDTAYFNGYWENRTVSGVNRMLTTYMGSAIIMTVRNTTKITANFIIDNGVSGINPPIHYRIDGGDWVDTSVSSELILSSNLSTTEHIIEIRTGHMSIEDNVFYTLKGLWNLTGFTLDSGGVAEPIKANNRHVLILGDSISAGVGAGVNKGYVARTCEKLNLQDIRVTIPSSALVNNPSRPSLPNLNNFGFRSSAGVYAESDTPDFIVVNIGTNDASVSASSFLNGYRNLLDRLQRKFPGTVVFCLRPFNGTHTVSVSQASLEYINAVYVDTTEWSYTTTDGSHLDEAGAESIANQLSSFLLNYFGEAYFVV